MSARRTAVIAGVFVAIVLAGVAGYGLGFTSGRSAQRAEAQAAPPRIAVTPRLDINPATPDAVEHARKRLKFHPSTDGEKAVSAIQEGRSWGWGEEDGGDATCHTFLLTPDGIIWSLNNGLGTPGGVEVGTTTFDYSCSRQIVPRPLTPKPGG